MRLLLLVLPTLISAVLLSAPRPVGLSSRTPSRRSPAVRMEGPSVGTLYDVPVSNNGARCRMVLYYKQITEAEVAIVSPAALGGLKSADFLAINPQGKMPTLVLSADGTPLPESDTIARFLVSKFADRGPQLQPTDPEAAALCDRCVPTHSSARSARHLGTRRGDRPPRPHAYALTPAHAHSCQRTCRPQNLPPSRHLPCWLPERHVQACRQRWG